MLDEEEFVIVELVQLPPQWGGTLDRSIKDVGALSDHYLLAVELAVGKQTLFGPLQIYLCAQFWISQMLISAVRN